MKTVAEIKSSLKLSHTSLIRGYVSTKSCGVVYPYVGKFGKGYKVLTNNRDSSRYCYVSYYVEA